MSRLLAIVSAAVLLAGCQNAPVGTDPFLRTRVPPEGTALSPPVGGYPAGAAPAVVAPPAQPAITSPAFSAPAARQPTKTGPINFEQQTTIDRARTTPAAKANNKRTTASVAPTTADEDVADKLVAANDELAAAESDADKNVDVAEATVVAASKRTDEAEDRAQLATFNEPVTLKLSSSDRAKENPTPATKRSAALAGEVGTPTGAGAPKRSTLRVLGDASEPAETVRVEAQPAEEPSPKTESVPWHPAETTATKPATVGQDAFRETSARVTPKATRSDIPQSTYAHDANYQWLRGKLEYSAAAKQWKLRYIPIDGKTDSYGGSVVLGGEAQLDGFKAGQFVTAQGRLAADGNGGRGFAPLYELSQVEPQSR